MYIEPRIVKDRKQLKKALAGYKELGLQAYISKNETYAYGLITDGNDIITLNMEYDGLTVSFKWKPSRETGSGCIIDRNLTLTDKLVDTEKFRVWCKEGHMKAAWFRAKLYEPTKTETAFDVYKNTNKFFDFYEEI